MIGSNAVTSPPGDGRQSAVPSGPSTRSTGSLFATTTKEAGSSFHSSRLGLMNVVTSLRRCPSTLVAPCGQGPASTGAIDPWAGAARLVYPLTGGVDTRHDLWKARHMSLPEPLTAAGAKALQAILSSPSDTLI